MEKSIKKTFFILATFILSIIFIFTIGELYYRIFPSRGFLSFVDPELHHTPRPYINIERIGWNSRYITNSLGWRDKLPHHEIKKITDREKRIVFLGDSFTEGFGVNYENTFVGIAETKLIQNNYHFEILNGGTASYSPLLEYQRLKKLLQQGYKVDTVILLPDLSDIQDEVFYFKKDHFDNFHNPPQFMSFRFRHPWMVFLLNTSAFFRIITRCFIGDHYRSFGLIPSLYDSSKKVENIIKNRSLNESHIITSEDLVKINSPTLIWNLKPFPLEYKPSFLGWAQDGVQFFKTNIAKIKKLCDENNISLIVAYYPWPQELYTKDNPSQYEILKTYFKLLFQARSLLYGVSPYPIPSFYENLMQSICKDHNLNCINLYPELRKQNDWYQLFIKNDCHFNEKGHEVVGGKLASELMRIFKRHY